MFAKSLDTMQYVEEYWQVVVPDRVECDTDTTNYP